MDVQVISEFLKSLVVDLSAAEVIEKARGHYKTLRLYDEATGWQVRELENAAAKLLPEKVDAGSLNELIDGVIQGVTDNPYLHAVITELDPDAFPEMKSRVNDKEAMLSFITLAWSIEQLCQFLREESEAIEALTSYWREVREKEGSWALYNTFEKAKLVTIEKGNKKKLACIRNGEIAPTFGKWFLRINVFEAFLEDLRLGFWRNAVSCIPLMVHSNDGQTAISEDKKIVAYSYPHAERWCNLYTAWNLGFTSHYENFPHLFIKLLIPQVNLYRKKPTEYMGNRSHALYIFLNYVCFIRKDIADGKAKKIQWNSDGFSNHFGAVNRKSALRYATLLYEENPTVMNRFWLWLQKKLS